jgi:LysR family glycine cleavage system transcriptional activator
MTLTDAGARLLPGISDGLAAFARAVELVRATAADAPLIVTTTNAFAARWLIPRLPDWRERHPDLPLQVIGTDSLVDLHAGAAHLAIRYARLPPKGWFPPNCGRSPLASLRADRHANQSKQAEGDRSAWAHVDTRSVAARRRRRSHLEAMAVCSTRGGAERARMERHETPHLREDAHAIEAAIAGQGLAMCSDVLVAREFADGRLVRFSTLSLQGYGFFVVSMPELALDHRVLSFKEWITSCAAGDFPEHRHGRLSLPYRRRKRS